MRMEDFLMRECRITGQHGVTVIRTRTSSGFMSITIRIDGTEDKDGNPRASQSMTFSSDNHGADYETVAREVREALDNICDEICALPSSKEGG